MEENQSNFSSLTGHSSRSEHMAYLIEEMGLDTRTAAILYRAERLQEKGQLAQALKYYQQVLLTKPDCTEALENARMTEDLLQEQQTKRPSLESISEKRNAEAYTTIEMEVRWSAYEIIECNYFPDADEAALDEVKRLLRKTGHGHSPLKLVQNEVLKDKCDAETEYRTWLNGKATFQVTLIRDDVDEVYRNACEVVDPATIATLLQTIMNRALSDLGNLGCTAPLNATAFGHEIDLARPGNEDDNEAVEPPFGTTGDEHLVNLPNSSANSTSTPPNIMAS